MTCSYSFDPSEHPDAGIDVKWDCPHEPVEGADRCIFHMDEETRRNHGISNEDIQRKIIENLSNGEEENEYVGAKIPKLVFNYETVEGSTTHPINFQHAEIGELQLQKSQVEQGVDLTHARVGKMIIRKAELNGTFRLNYATVEGKIDAFETSFNNSFRARNAEFRDKVSFDEAFFNEELNLQNAEFHGEASFQVAEFSGRSHRTDDNSDFTSAVFRDQVLFDEAEMKHSDFTDVEFRGEASFEETVIEGDVLFSGAEFRAKADFFRTRFRERTEFEAVFSELARFQEARFYSDAEFDGTVFEDHADFDEARFYEDTSFREVKFTTAEFRGAEFQGENKHLEDSAVFDQSTFAGKADFDNVEFTSASFQDVRFGDTVDFRKCSFDRADFEVYPIDTDIYVDMTGAKILDGVIKQTAKGIVPYDFTRATLGDVRLTGETNRLELLDHFRFCLTEFDGFDFAEHHDYLERNDWKIHEFVENQAEIEYSEHMTPEVTERTYLKAQNSAQEKGDKTATAAFELKRNRYNRRKNRMMALDTSEPLSLVTRAKKMGGVIGNQFMDWTCGYGTKLFRITALTFVTPIFFALLYLQRGVFRTHAKGFGDALYYSYITFSSVGYGDISPLAPGSKVLASAEGMLGGLFIALFIYTLSKRVDY
ncbi:MAG: pentapeptide repeat-containing protein [Candidatus Nanohaloarchaea archaeon]